MGLKTTCINTPDMLCQFGTNIRIVLCWKCLATLVQAKRSCTFHSGEYQFCIRRWLFRNSLSFARRLDKFLQQLSQSTLEAWRWKRAMNSCSVSVGLWTTMWNHALSTSSNWAGLAKRTRMSCIFPLKASLNVLKYTNVFSGYGKQLSKTQLFNNSF